MISHKYVLFLMYTALKICTPLKVGEFCTMETSGYPGVCKIITDCSVVKNHVIKFQVLPQTCGFIGTQTIVCCPKDLLPGDISRLKCKKYASYAYSDNSNASKSECGHNIVKRIANGTAASRKEFAHMASLGYEHEEGKISWLCGGSLISESYILTAAQCLKNLDILPPKHVRLGVIDVNNNDHKQQIRVSQVIPHPDFRLSSHYNDIGLVKLEQPVNLNLYVRPACLHTNELILTQAIATGWGDTSFDGFPSEILLKVTLDLENDSCKKQYRNFTSRKLQQGILKNSQICAGSSDNEKDTCQGDAGGPLQVYHDGDDEVACMYDIIGITSFGKSHCTLSPSVYTRVSRYIEWIEDIVWPKTMLNI